MSAGRWNLATQIEDEDTSPDRPMPTLVSLHFIRTALRRRLLVCVLAAVLGLLAAGTFLVAFPLPHQARATLVLASDPDVDSSRAMSTNVSLLQTRTVALETTERLGLTMPPEDFLKSFTVEAENAELMTLTISAPTDAEAVRRLEGLTETYLAFRARQLSMQSENFTNGLQNRIEELRAEIKKLTRQADQISAQRPVNTDQLDDVVGRRAYVNDRIEALQQQVEDATLRNSSVVSSSRVLDPPAAVPGLAKRTIVLVLASGLIGGAALGCGTVLFLAIISDKLRRRADVAAALGVPVPVSVGRVNPVGRAWRWVPPLASADHRRAENRMRLAQAIEDELLARPPARVVVAGLDNADELGSTVAELAIGLAGRDYTPTVIDLTERGSRGLASTLWAASSSSAPSVLRPRGLPALARTAGDLLPVGQWDDADTTVSPSLGDVTLVLADLDPAVGADHLVEWADRVVLVITAGRSTVEKVRTIADLIRAAGLDLRFAMLLHAERTDDSSGVGSTEVPAAVPLPKSDNPVAPAARTEAQ
jgi:capsular polysaccharide biosynthesis protein